jgi:hypothetical protein
VKSENLSRNSCSSRCTIEWKNGMRDAAAIWIRAPHSGPCRLTANRNHIIG